MYENKYSTKICDFTVLRAKEIGFAKSLADIAELSEPCDRHLSY